MLASIISVTFSASLDLKTVNVIATFLLHSNLGYCNSFYLNLLPKQTYRLQLLQNSLARAVTGTPNTEHITPVLKSLHWLNIEQRIHYKIISRTFDHFFILINPSTSENLEILNRFAGSTRHSDYLRPSASYLKISNRSFN